MKLDEKDSNEQLLLCYQHQSQIERSMSFLDNISLVEQVFLCEEEDRKAITLPPSSNESSVLLINIGKIPRASSVELHKIAYKGPEDSLHVFEKSNNYENCSIESKSYTDNNFFYFGRITFNFKDSNYLIHTEKIIEELYAIAQHQLGTEMMMCHLYIDTDYLSNIVTERNYSEFKRQLDNIQNNINILIIPCRANHYIIIQIFGFE